MALALKSQQVDLSGLDLVVKSIQTGAASSTQGNHSTMNNFAGTPRSITTTTPTLLAADFLSGFLAILQAGAVTLTLDTAANLVTAFNTLLTSNANVGDVFSCEIINGGNTAGAITVAVAGTVTFDSSAVAANRVIAINTARTVFIRLTNVTAGSEAAVIYL